MGVSEKIKEGNILIAKFNGLHKDIYGKWCSTDDGVKAIGDSELLYHLSWDWLMPVVEKINRFDWVTIYGNSCKIHALNVKEFEPIEHEVEGGKLIESVYDCIVRYIEIFNTQKNK
jgi:hypothetical protein